ncbi:MAG TPA: anti-sigma factor [Acetobacteraceae bacterium]|nr:anti-sigma factor [Acetobacteraceae bacterium]
MSLPERPIGEDDLHAYVDGFLSPSECAAVEAYLGRAPDAARQVAEWQDQNNALRAAFAPMAAEPLPVGLSLARLVEARVARRRMGWRIAAGLVLALSVGSAGGWFAHRPGQPSGMSALGLEASAAYRVFATDPRHPVEMAAAQRGQLVAWLTRRMGREVAPPDLSAAGYRFMGGRLLATTHGPAALFMYDDGRGVRLVVMVRPMQRPEADTGGTMTRIRHANLNGFVWTRAGLGYSLVGEAPANTLHPIANDVRRAPPGV